MHKSIATCYVRRWGQVTTAEIVKVLRQEASGLYHGYSYPWGGDHRVVADALRRAAKRLSRLADERLAEQVDLDMGTWWTHRLLDAYRRAITGGQG